MSSVTLSELIEQALGELDHPEDTAALPLWQDKLMRFANEAIVDMTETFRPWRRDPLPLNNGTLNLLELPYRVGKVLGVERDGMRIPFYYGANAVTLRVPGMEDGTVTVVYRYLPRPLLEATDEPELPAACHPLIVLYMVGRFTVHEDAQGLSQANMMLSLYEARKRRLKLDFDEPTGYTIYNRY